MAGRHCAKIPSSAFKTYLWRLAAWFRRAVSETGQTLFPLALITYDAVDLPRKLSACDFMVCIRCTFVGGGLSKKKLKKLKISLFGEYVDQLRCHEGSEGPIGKLPAL